MPENLLITTLLFLLLHTVYVRGAAGLISITFWAPYIGYVSFVLFLIRMLDIFMINKAKCMKFGYTYKLCSKILLGLLNTREVVEIMKGVRFDKPHVYICKDDRELPSESQTRFKVKFLTAKDQAHIRDIMYNVSGMGKERSEKFLTGTAALKALEMGLVGWENFNYEDDGGEISFSKENLSCIRPNVRDEIANYVRGVEEGEI